MRKFRQFNFAHIYYYFFEYVFITKNFIFYLHHFSKNPSKIQHKTTNFSTHLREKKTNVPSNSFNFRFFLEINGTIGQILRAKLIYKTCIAQSISAIEKCWASLFYRFIRTKWNKKNFNITNLAQFSSQLWINIAGVPKHKMNSAPTF